MSEPNRTADALSWRKSRASVSGECVEVASSGETVAIRDSTNVEGSVLRFTARAWNEFLDGLSNPG